ncbi:hypothetical protein ACSBR2_005477 [Camellia fascicularis]
MCIVNTLYLKFLDSCCDVHNWSSVWPHSWTITGISLNKPLYTISYMLVTFASAGITFFALYILVSSKQ